MSKRVISIGLADIPTDLAFEGYLWLSNERKPRMFRNEPVDMELFQDLPFVVEGNLWAASEQISIQIRNIDGNYRVLRFDLSNSENDPLLGDDQEYIAHDLEEFGTYRVFEAWKEEADELLEGMKTLVPAWTAFKGFGTTKNQ